MSQEHKREHPTRRSPPVGGEAVAAQSPGAGFFEVARGSGEPHDCGGQEGSQRAARSSRHLQPAARRFRGGRVFAQPASAQPITGVPAFMAALKERRTLTLMEGFQASGLDADALDDALGDLPPEQRQHVQMKKGPKGMYWAWKR